MGAVAAMRVLVAYYSLSGYTASLAQATAAALRGGPGGEGAEEAGAHEVELLEIVPAKPYSYFTAGVKGVTQAMSGAIVELLTLVPESGAYDAVVILSPTWGWMSSPPVRSFVAHLPEGEGRPAVVGVTHAGGPIGSFDRLAALVAERGYDVRERLSVFCYSADAIAEAAAQTVTALGQAGGG
jgi:hypothetical protein